MSARVRPTRSAKKPNREAPGGRGQQGERVHQAHVHREVAHEVHEHHGVEHHVHGVEHPAEAARHERAALGLGHVGGPLEPEDARRASRARRGRHGPPALQRAWMRSRAAMAAPRAPAMSRWGTTSKRDDLHLLLPERRVLAYLCEEPLAEMGRGLDDTAAQEVGVGVGEVRGDGEEPPHRLRLLLEDRQSQGVALLPVAAHELRRLGQRLGLRSSWSG